MPPKFNKSGLIVVDKPAGLSSAAAIRKLQKRFDIPKIGHGGTLDPFATGVLLVLVGEATKVARFLLDGQKSYEALARVGWETSTDDCEGEPLREAAPSASESERVAADNVIVDQQAWENARARFVGTISQVPPIYSAIKIQGKPAYAYARASQEVKLEAREVQIESLKIIEAGPHSLKFRVTCGGGTYIRVLAKDWARAVGTRAHLEELRRLSVGIFTLEQATSLDDLLNAESLEPHLFPLQQALAHLPEQFCGSEISPQLRAGNLAVLAKVLTENDHPAEASILLTTAADNGSGKVPLAIVKRQTDSRKPFVFERVFVSP